MRNNILEIVKSGLCTSCGLCTGACNKKSITFSYGPERNVPVVDLKTCVNCGICYDICPGKGIELVRQGNDLFSSESDDNYSLYCGHYLNSYTGYSSDDDIRFHSASGGMLTSFLLYLLRTKVIGGAVVVGYKKDDPLVPEPYIATTEDEILRSRGSKYVVTSFNNVVSDMIAFDGRLVVVGLPCHIQGLRNLVQKNKNLKAKIIGYFSIYCSLNKTKHSIDYYLSHYQINRERVGYFSFRDDGCMGYMKYADKQNNTIMKVPYTSFWYGSHSFFQNSRCALCADHFGELADISFGDINIPPYNRDKVGISSMVVRSNVWNEYLKACAEDGYIQLKNCPIEDVIKSQGYSKSYKKGRGIQSFLQFRKLLGKKNPAYDVPFEGKPSLSGYISVLIKYLMFYVGKNKSLWFIIHLLDRSKKTAVYE